MNKNKFINFKTLFIKPNNFFIDIFHTILEKNSQK